MRVSAKVDYALRAMLELAAAGGLVKGEQLATAQGIPQKFLESILIDLRHADIRHEHVRLPGVEKLQALFRTRCRFNDCSRFIENESQQVARVRFVIHDENLETYQFIAGLY